MEVRKRKKLYIILSLLAVAVLVAVLSVVHAKYIFDKINRENQIKAENFYFTVDLLGHAEDISLGNTEETTKTIDVFGQSAMSFSVQNYFDELRINSTDVKYTVSMQTDIEGAELSCGGAVADSFTKTLSGGSKASEAFTLALPNDYEHLAEAEITVKAEKDSSGVGYEKTMTLKFVMHKYAYELLYRIDDEGNDSEYVSLVVMSNIDVQKDSIIIDWQTVNSTGNRLQVDSTSSYILTDGVLSGKNDPAIQGGFLKEVVITEDISAMQSFSLVFYKSPKGFSCTGDESVNPIYVEPNSQNSYFGVSRVTVDGKTTYTIKIIENQSST